MSSPPSLGRMMGMSPAHLIDRRMIDCGRSLPVAQQGLLEIHTISVSEPISWLTVKIRCKINVDHHLIDHIRIRSSEEFMRLDTTTQQPQEHRHFPPAPVPTLHLGRGLGLDHPDLGR